MNHGMIYSLHAMVLPICIRQCPCQPQRSPFTTIFWPRLPAKRKQRMGTDSSIRTARHNENNPTNQREPGAYPNKCGTTTNGSFYHAAVPRHLNAQTAVAAAKRKRGNKPTRAAKQRRVAPEKKTSAFAFSNAVSKGVSVASRCPIHFRID